MIYRVSIFLICLLLFFSCSKKEPEYVPQNVKDPYALYKEGIEAFKKNDFFFANKKIF